jgi:hypothetical protein
MRHVNIDAEPLNRLSITSDLPSVHHGLIESGRERSELQMLIETLAAETNSSSRLTRHKAG